MKNSPSEIAASGASMDKIVPRRRGKSYFIAAATFLFFVVCAYFMWHGLPRGLQVAASDVSIANVEKGLFQDKIIVRASAAPLHSMILDSVESGRVEEVSACPGRS